MVLRRVFKRKIMKKVFTSRSVLQKQSVQKAKDTLWFSYKDCIFWDNTKQKTKNLYVTDNSTFVY